MKIFNWVHRKFHHKDGKKAEFITNETETQVLLEHVNIADVLNVWRDGILTIGTFGFDPLNDFNQKNGCPVFEKKEECDEEEYAVDNELDDENDMKECDEEELNPLVFTAFGCGYDEGSGSKYDENALKMAIYGSSTDDPLSPRPYELGFYSEEDGKGSKKRERTTLADLFSADSDVNIKRDRSNLQPDSIKKPHIHAKKGFSFAKKLIPRVGEDARPIKKLQQLMKMMLKRKIHPDFEGKIQKRESQVKPTTILGLLAEEYGANESVSLLQTEDAIV